MAKVIRSLTAQDHSTEIVLLDESELALAEGTCAPHKRPALRAVKRAEGARVKRERPASLPANLLAGLTPRQIKRVKARPAVLEALRREFENSLENNS
jgi:hypothetical protein